MQYVKINTKYIKLKILVAIKFEKLNYIVFNLCSEGQL